MPRAQPLLVTRRFPASQYSETVNTVNQMSEIYRVWVPRGQVWMIDPSVPVRILLATQETVTPAGSQAAEAVTYPIARVLEVAGGYTDGDFQAVHLSADNSARTITAVADHVDSLASPTITCSDETNAAHVYSYIPATGGELVVQIEAPRGQGQLAYPIMTRNTMQLHTMNQHRDLRWPSPMPIPEDFAIVLKLNAAWQVAWDTGATGATNLTFCMIQFGVKWRPMRDFYAGEKEKGRGLKLRNDVERTMFKSVR